MIVFYWWEEADGCAGGSRSEGGRRWIWVDTARRLHKLLLLGIIQASLILLSLTRNSPYCVSCINN